jgi:DNA-binding transcriptional MerR regulator
MTKKQSLLYLIAIICTRLEQGVPEEDIRKLLDLDNDLFLSYIEFSLEIKLIKRTGNMLTALVN